MESVAKRYFWLVNLALLAGLAFLSARVANNLLAEQLVSVKPQRKAPEAKVKQKSTIKGMALGWGELIRDRNLFNANPPEPVEETPEDETEEKVEEALDPDKIPAPGEDCKEWEESTIQLNATLVAEPAAWSTATVTENGKARMLRVGDMVGNHELVAIQRERLIVAEANKFKCVKSKRISSKKAKSSRYKPARSTYKSGSNYSKKGRKNDSEKIKAGIKKVGKNTYQVDRDMLNEQLEDLGKLSRQARVIPHYRGGKPKGFKLVGVRPGSLYSHIGVRSGDILKSVNGEGITSPTKALELFEKLKSSESVTVDLERRGRKTTYEYIIK